MPVVGFNLSPGSIYDQQYPFYGIPAMIAINMIMCCAAGGTLSVIIAVWAQVRLVCASQVRSNHT